MTRRDGCQLGRGVVARGDYWLASAPAVSDPDLMSEQGAGEGGWDEFGERIVGVGTCAYCGEEIDQWETRIEPEIHVRRPVLLWKHHVDGAVLCGRAQPATPVGGS